MTQANTYSILSTSINAWLRQSEQTLVILVFSSAWSGSAHILISNLKTILRNYPKVKMHLIDIEKKPDLARRFGVSSIPTTAFLQDHKVIQLLKGAQSKKKLLKQVRTLG